MFVYKSQNGISFLRMRERKISIKTKFIKFIIGANHPKIIENSTRGCGINFGAVV